ncbi:MAG: hypothetical protein WBA17_06095 [Saprospiraceae bacterium]
MKTLFPLFALCLVLFLSSGCGNDDDGGPDPGVLRITLTWQEAGTDLDLVIQSTAGLYGPAEGTPSDTDITVSADDLSGPGEEFVNWQANAPDGVYTVSVDNLEFEDVDYTLRIKSAGTDRTFEETVDDFETNTITFTKTGTTLTF